MKTTLDFCHMRKEDTILFNQIASKNRLRYTKFVDHLSSFHKNDFYWWVTPFSSRNPYLSNAFQNICTALLAKHYIDSDPSLGSILVKELSVKKVLEKYVKEQHKSISVQSFQIIESSVEAESAGFLGTWKQIQDQCQLAREKQNQISYSLKEDFILTDTYVLSSCFQNGTYHDRYFNNLMDYTNQKIYFTPILCINDTTSLQQMFQNLKQSKTYPFLLKEHFITDFNLLQMKRYPKQCKRYLLRQALHFGGLDVSEIVNADIIQGINQINSIHGMMGYFFIKNLSKQTKALKQSILYYESQPSSLGISMALRRFYPSVESMGYLAFPLLENWLGLRISPEQIRQKVVPTQMGVIGTGYETIEKKFTDQVRVQVVPTLRSKEVFSFQRSAKKHASFHILVVLPYFMKTCIAMLDELMESLHSFSQKDIHIFIKNHPVNLRKNSRDYKLSDSSIPITFVEGTLFECLVSADLIVTSKTTSLTELFTTRIPILAYVEAGELTSLGIPKSVSPNLFRLVYDKTDLEQAWKDFLEQPPKIKESESNFVLEHYFCKPTPETIKRFFIEDKKG